MTPWIQVFSNLPAHPKTYKLAEKLNISNSYVVGILVCIWSWAAVNTPDGNLSVYHNIRKIIEEITSWNRKKIDLYQALIDTGWLDITDNKCVIHDWHDYSAIGFKEKQEKQKNQNAERQQRFRDKQKSNVTNNVTSQPTIQIQHNNNNSNNTSPNITLSEPEVETEREDRDRNKDRNGFERCKGYYCKTLCVDDVPMQAIGAFLKALDNGIELELIERVISDSADKNTPAAWLKVVVDNFIRDGVRSVTQYRGKSAESQSSGGSFDTDEFFELAMKRSYDNMKNMKEKEESPAIVASD